MPDCEPFGAQGVGRTADRLALAARCTASFPIAFEPVYVPVDSPLHQLPPGVEPEPTSSACDRTSAASSTSWGDDAPLRDRSRFVVDSSVLANVPTRAALEAVQSMPAEGAGPRVMLLVYPHAERAGDDVADRQDEQPHRRRHHL